MRSPTVAYAIVVALLVTVLAVPSASAIGDTGQNEVQINISNWLYWGNSSPSTGIDSIDVSFKISFDIDNDGSFDQVNESSTFSDESALGGPFQAICIVNDSIQSVTFQVLAIWHNGTATSALEYGYPVTHTASNVDYANDSWSYTTYNYEGAGPDKCVIFYSYITYPIYNWSQDGDSANTTSGGFSFDLNDQTTVLIIALVAVAALLIIAGVFAYVSRSKSKLFMPIPRKETRVPRDGQDFCQHCGKLFPGEVDYCPYCGVKKMK